MAQRGDSYTVSLKQPHLEWGTYRFTGSRGDVYGEGYIPIRKDIAIQFHLLNSNGTHGLNSLGVNIFHCKSSDGYYNGDLRAQGNSSKDDIYAKQFAGDNDLKAIGRWYAYINATVGTMIKIEWLSPYDIEISKI